MMNEKKVTAKPVGALGRIVIPDEARELLGMHPGTSVDIIVEGNSLVIKLHEDTCVFCGSKDELVGFNGKFICKACARAVWLKAN